MSAFVTASITALAALAVGHTLATLGSIVLPGWPWLLRRRTPDEGLPKAVVMLPLRGADPFLPRTIEALVRQDYPDFELQVVVDHRDDPAYDLVQAALELTPSPRVRVGVLEERLETCSLLNSALVQTVRRLDESVEVLVSLDADVQPHPSWLRELVTPLRDPGVGACAGNRWYMPSDGRFANMVRYVWNAAAVCQMYWSDHTWGGSIAMRVAAIRRPEVLERWSRAFAFDTTVHGVMREQDLAVRFVPEVLMVNRESCQLGSFAVWMRRQMMLTRLYHRAWPAILTGGMVISVLPLLVPLAGAALWAAGQGDSGGALLRASGLYYAWVAGLLALGEGAVRLVLWRRGEPTGWLDLRKLLATLAAIPAVHALYAATLPRVASNRDVTWRQVPYRIDGPFQVAVLDYAPYQADDTQGTETIM